MLVDYLSQYGLFLAKALTVIFGLLFLVVAILVLVMKNKHKHEGTLHIKHLNKERHEVSHHLQEEMLEKSDFKRWRKARKALDKR
jgi:serine protease SohB